MGSRLDAVQAELFDMLHGRGMTYAQVAEEAEKKGVQISRQGLHIWHKRKLKKMAFRAAQLPSTARAPALLGKFEAPARPISSAPSKPAQAQVREMSNDDIARKLLARAMEYENKLNANPLYQGPIKSGPEPKGGHRTD